MNRVYLLGNLGQDPEMKATKNGTSVANFSVATTEYGKDNEGNKTEYVEWNKIVAFGKTAELCGEYIRKGSKVLIEGAIRNRSWDKDDGTKGYMTEVVASNVQFLSPRQDS